MMATQEGSIVGQRVYTVGGTTSEPQDRLVRDLDFESGRFFWAVDPATLPNFPFVDILNLDAVAIPTAIQPADAQVRVYRYRTGGGIGLNPNLGGITAIGFRPDGHERVEGTRQLLLQGTDYYLDPSATWFALATRLDQNDYLAVSYVTVDGTRVGTFPADGNPAVTDSVVLVALPLQGPAQQTFRHEMRQVYRVSGTDLDKPSLRVTVTLNQSERPSNADAPAYLAFFGLAIPPDPHVFDVGKWGLGHVGTTGSPNRQGFDLFFGYYCQGHAHGFYPGHLWRNDRKVKLNNEPPVPSREKLPAGADPHDPAAYAAFKGSDYVSVVNDNREYGEYVGQHGLVMENGRPSVTTLSIARDSIRLLNFLDIKPVLLPNERCCGHDLLWTGDVENFRTLCRLNYETFQAAGVKEIVVSCPEGYHVLHAHMPAVIVEGSWAISYAVNERKLMNTSW